jgi:hypothetical protein
LQQMLDGAGDSVESGGEYDGEVFPPCVRDERVQTGASRPAPGDAAVLIFLHDLEAALRRKLSQIIKLAFDMLVGTTHAHINGGSQWVPP